MDMIRNFLEICDCKFDWNLESYLEDSIKSIQKQAADKKVFLLVSGGVDSNVAFSLLNKALGEQNVYGLHIDNGFMRLNESSWVKDTLEESGFHNFHVVNAENTFLDNIADVWEPQEKRKIIGDTFLDVKEQAVEDIHIIVYLFDDFRLSVSHFRVLIKVILISELIVVILIIHLAAKVYNLI